MEARGLSGLPDDVLGLIAGYLTLCDIHAWKSSNKRFNGFFNAKMNNPRLPLGSRIYDVFKEKKSTVEEIKRKADQKRDDALSDVSQTGRNLLLQVISFNTFGEIGNECHHKLLKLGITVWMAGSFGTLMVIAGLAVGPMIEEKVSTDDVRLFLGMSPILLLALAVVAIGCLMTGGSLCYSSMTLFNRVNSSNSVDREDRRLAERLAAMEAGIPALASNGADIGTSPTEVPGETTALLRRA